MADFKRQIALKVRIKDLIDGEYVSEEGINPNYIKSRDRGEIYRVNLIAVVVGLDNNENYNGLVLDDGSGKISVMFFENNKFDVDIGDVVLVIGRPRIYGGEKYLVPEIVKKIENKKWIDVRNLELKKSIRDYSNKVVLEGDLEFVSEDAGEERSDSEKILDMIRENDKGDGIDVSNIISKFKEAEKLVDLLLKEGEIFEIRPGRVKILE